MIGTNELHISRQKAFIDILFFYFQKPFIILITSSVFLEKQQVLTHPLTSHTPLTCQPFYHNPSPHSSTSLAIPASDHVIPRRRETRPSFTSGKSFSPSALENSH